jgi:hypothetical protein
MGAGVREPQLPGAWPLGPGSSLHPAKAGFATARDDEEYAEGLATIRINESAVQATSDDPAAPPLTSKIDQRSLRFSIFPPLSVALAGALGGILAITVAEATAVPRLPL